MDFCVFEIMKTFTLSPALSALIGTLIGGMITYFVNRTNNQTQKHIQILQYRKERLERLKKEAERIFSHLNKLKPENGISKEDLSEEDHHKIFQKNIELLKLIQDLVLIHYPKLSNQIQTVVKSYYESEFADSKKGKFMAGIDNMNREMWDLRHLIQKEIEKEEDKIQNI